MAKAALVQAESKIIMQDKSYGREIILPKGDYLLVNVASSTTMKPKTEDWCSRWVGSVMKLTKIYIGYPTIFRYVKTNDGQSWNGDMHTSSVVDYHVSSDEKIVTIATINTIYTFNKIEED